MALIITHLREASTHIVDVEAQKQHIRTKKKNIFVMIRFFLFKV